MDLQGLHVSAIVDDQLQEEFIDRLKVWPSGVHQELFFFHADSFSRKSRLLEDGQGPENIFFDHVNDQIEMGNDDCGHAGGVSKEVVELLEVALSVSFLLDVLRVVVEVKGRRTGLEFFQELIFELSGQVLGIVGFCRLGCWGFGCGALGGGRGRFWSTSHV